MPCSSVIKGTCQRFATVIASHVLAGCRSKLEGHTVTHVYFLVLLSWLEPPECLVSVKCVKVEASAGVRDGWCLRHERLGVEA